MKKLPLYILIILCFPSFAFESFETQVSLDSLQKRYGSSAGQNKLNALLDLSKFYWNIDPTQAIEKSKHALGTAQSLESTPEIIKAMFYVGTAYYYDNQLDNALDYLLQAHHYAGKNNFKKEIADISMQLATVYYETNRLNKSYSYTIQAFNIYETFGDEGGVAGCENLLGLYYKGIGVYDEAQKHFEIALEIGKKLSRKK